MSVAGVRAQGGDPQLEQALDRAWRDLSEVVEALVLGRLRHEARGRSEEQPRHATGDRHT